MPKCDFNIEVSILFKSRFCMGVFTEHLFLITRLDGCFCYSHVKDKSEYRAKKNLSEAATGSVL